MYSIKLKENEIENLKIKSYLKGMFSKQGDLILTNKRILFISENKLNENILCFDFNNIKNIKTNSNELNIILLKNQVFNFNILNNENINDFLKLYENAIKFNSNNKDIIKKDIIKSNKISKFEEDKKINDLKNLEIKKLIDSSVNIIKNEKNIFIKGKFSFDINMFYDIFIKDNGYYNLVNYYKDINNKILLNEDWYSKNDKYYKNFKLEKKVNDIPFKNFVIVNIKQELIKEQNLIIWDLTFSNDAPYGKSYQINLKLNISQQNEYNCELIGTLDIKFFNFILVKTIITNRVNKEIRESFYNFLNNGIKNIPKDLLKINITKINKNENIVKEEEKIIKENIRTNVFTKYYLYYKLLLFVTVISIILLKFYSN